MRAPRRTAVAVAVLALALTASCSSDDDGATPTPSPSASASSPSSSPSALPTQEPSSSAEPTKPASLTTASVYFLSSEKLQAAPRPVVGPAVGAAAVRALLTGPLRSEQAAGLRTTVPSGTVLNSLDVSGGLATVDLSSGFGGGGGSLSMRARVAQVVFTLTQFPTVQRVAFRLDGKPVTSLGGEGVDLSRPVTRADYESLSPQVLVEQPRWGEDVSAPVRVRGTANTFEAVFFVELLSPRGSVLARQRVMATSGSGTRGTFDVTLRASLTDPGSGTLKTFVYSAENGARQDVSSIPVRLVP